MQNKFTESQLLELKCYPECDFKVTPSAAYLGLDMRLNNINVVAFLEIFKNKRRGQNSAEEEAACPIAQKEEPRRFVRVIRPLHIKSKVYNGLSRDDV